MFYVCPQTKQWVADLKMNGDVFGVAFTADSRFMFSTGCEGSFCIWGGGGGTLLIAQGYRTN